MESHSDDVTDLSFQPANPSILLSGSTDGLVNLYDTKITEEDDALIQVFNHGSSIAHAGFLSDQELYALSSDEIFSIYDTGDFQPDGDHEVTRAFGDLRPQLQCEYLVDLVTSASTGPILAAGSHRSAPLLSLLGTSLTLAQHPESKSCPSPKGTTLVTRHPPCAKSSGCSWRRGSSVNLFQR